MEGHHDIDRRIVGVVRKMAGLHAELGRLTSDTTGARMGPPSPTPPPTNVCPKSKDLFLGEGGHSCLRGLLAQAEVVGGEGMVTPCHAKCR